MSARLSQNERHEIRKFIEEKFDGKEREAAAIDPDWQTNVTEQSRKTAIGSLRIEKDLLKLDSLRKQIEALDAEANELEKKVQLRLPYKDLGDDWDDEDAETARKRKNRTLGGCRARMGICEAIEYIMERNRIAVMKRSKVGFAILKVREERDRRLALLQTCSTRDSLAETGCLKDL